MRHLLITALVFAFVSSMGLAAAPAHKAAGAHQIVGELVSASATTVVVKESVKGGQAKEVTFTTNDKTKVRVHGKFAKFEELKPGEEVTVKYTKEGDAMIASDISVAAAKAAPAAAPAPATKPAPAPTSATAPKK